MDCRVRRVIHEDEDKKRHNQLSSVRLLFVVFTREKVRCCVHSKCYVVRNFCNGAELERDRVLDGKPAWESSLSIWAQTERTTQPERKAGISAVRWVLWWSRV